MLRLNCVTQNYNWGKTAKKSEVARLYFAKCREYYDENEPYAELWMGTHPNGPSTCLDDNGGETLKEWIENNPKCLGKYSYTYFGNDLPFLLKVLSIETALSIQSHPDKKLAEKLYDEYPEIYKDPNHKPEMAIALGDFEALCGFVSTSELIQIFDTNKELCECIQRDLISQFKNADPSNIKSALKAVFKSLMTCPMKTCKKALEKHVNRLKLESNNRNLSDKEKLALVLNDQYPGDIGIFASYFLNYMRLKEGEAIFLPANEPHAYISGNIIECMATSDNVIRAGLTPKLRDVKVLCKSLHYSQKLPGYLKGEMLNEYLRCYRPPFEEFEVHSLTIPPGHQTNISNKGPMIMLIQFGNAELKVIKMKGDAEYPKTHKIINVTYGDAIFIPADVNVSVNVDDDQIEKEIFKAWIGCVNQKIMPNSCTQASNIVPIDDHTPLKILKQVKPNE